MTRTCEIRSAAHHGRHNPHWWSPRIGPGFWQRLTREIFLIAAFAVIYEEIREHMVQAGAVAARHALGIVSAEQFLGLFQERAVQAAIIGSDTVVDAFNAYYGYTHFLIPVLVMAWLMFWHPAHYGRARTALAVITGWRSSPSGSSRCRRRGSYLPASASWTRWWPRVVRGISTAR